MLANVARLVGLVLGAVLVVELAAVVGRHGRLRKIHRWAHEHRRARDGGNG